jgi:hypothetical protein
VSHGACSRSTSNSKAAAILEVRADLSSRVHEFKNSRGDLNRRAFELRKQDANNEDAKHRMTVGAYFYAVDEREEDGSVPRVTDETWSARDDD